MDKREDGSPRGFPSLDTLAITPATLAAIAEIDEFKGAWRALGHIAPERLAGLRRIATVRSAGSSTRIEGARLSDREVEQLLARVDSSSLASRDEQEVAGYAEVMDVIVERFESIDVTENHVRQLHRDLLRHSEKDARHRGAYKTVANHIEAFAPDGTPLGVVFETASPFETPARMAELFDWLAAHASPRSDLHPLLASAIFIVVLLEIHPFQDGNGRLSRILTTLLLLRAGYAYVPFESIESIVEERKADYYLALRATQQTLRGEAPDWAPWIDFFLGTLLEHKRRLERKLERQDRLDELPELSKDLLELARETGRLTIADGTASTGANRSTVKDHVRKLVERGLLERRGAGRGSWYAPA